jgi:hypothetical protein
MISEEIKLIKQQNHLEKTYKLDLMGKSLFQTIGELLRNNLIKESEDMRKEFKISDSEKRSVGITNPNCCKTYSFDIIYKLVVLKSKIPCRRFSLG